MLSFATEFPVNHVHNVTKVLAAIRSWVLESPHTKFVANDLAAIPDSGEWRICNDREALNVLYAQSASESSVAVRQTIVSGSLEWITNIVYSRNASDAWVGIQTSRESNHPAIRLPDAKKPIIVRALLEALGGSRDGDLLVSQEPYLLAHDDVGLAARLVLGTSGCRLPVLYVSCDFSGNYIANPKTLAYNLAGMAHVAVEPNRIFSRRLQVAVNSENVYGGTVGVYWPDGAGRRSFFIGGEFDTPAGIRKAIVEEIRIALTNRRPLLRCTWSAEAYKLLKESGSAGIEEYVAVFDSELKAKADQLADAEREIERLKSENRKHEMRGSASGGITLRTGNEHNLYGGEVAEIVRDAIQEASNRVQADSRRQHVLTAILENNPTPAAAKMLRETLKELLRNYSSMDGKVRKGLEELGFSVSDDGKHVKIVFQGDDRYTFTLAKSGSDHRGGLNAASDISKRLF